MTSKDNLISVPAQRYFSEEELCEVVGISSKQFAAWQRERGLIGWGGTHYSRLDVVKVLRLKATFAPYVDAFTHNFEDEAGQPAADPLEVKQQLCQLLQKIDDVLILSNIDS